MTKRSACPRCGAPLAGGGALSGLCPACLLRQGVGEPVACRPSPVTSSTDLSDVQREFPQFEILEEVGRGGMGIVYRARQPRLDREVALKVLKPELADHQDFAERFLREARALARMNHPNVVAVHDFGETGGNYFLVMEFVRGQTLRTYMDQGRLELEDVVELFPSICAGLAYAHAQDLVHRDVKPENILIDEQGTVKLTDFGLAKVLGQEEEWNLTRASQVMGTLHYMAPEQFHRPRSVDHRADVYALGVVLYEALTGVLPVGRFELPSRKSDLDPAVDEVLLRALEQEPDERFQSVVELATALGALPTSEEAPERGEQKGPAGRGRPSWPAGKRVPFKMTDVYGGFAEVRGMCGIEGDELVLEYRKVILDMVNTSVSSLRVPLAEFGEARAKAGWFGCKLLASTRSLTSIEALPCNHKGQLVLGFGKSLAPEVELLASCINAGPA